MACEEYEIEDGKHDHDSGKAPTKNIAYPMPSHGLPGSILRRDDRTFGRCMGKVIIWRRCHVGRFPENKSRRETRWTGRWFPRCRLSWLCAGASRPHMY